MIKAWTIVALGGFITISVFGVFLMPYDGSSHDTSCLASLVNNAKSPCPKEDPLGFANFHSSAIRAISNLIPINALSAAYMAIIACLILFGVFSTGFKKDNLAGLVVSRFELNKESYYYRLSRLDWFSLHENSPSYYSG